MKPATAAVSDFAATARFHLGTLADLAKARLTFLVLLTTLMGFCMGSVGRLNWWALLNVMVATALLASGAACLNQLFERGLDARMRRTRERPLPSGRVDPATALALGAASAVVGVIYLSVAVNAPSALVGLITLLTYLFIYTPLKTRSGLNTVVGAVPGAMPPLIGWTAAQGEISAGGYALFAIQFFWQLPHFYAIAWLYREDYATAGFKMLPVLDPSGERTGHQAVAGAIALLATSAAPFALGLAGVTYLGGALALGTVFLGLAASFARQRDDRSARRLFIGSILYLPALLGLMVWDKAG